MKGEKRSKTFRPRAKIIRTLGDELISNETVAIVELVKNAYDADAMRVLISFSGPLKQGYGLIEIIDDGHGMDQQTVESAWMELSTPSKRGELRFSPLFKRRFLGEKGIGRLASARLAESLEVITRRKRDPNETKAIFDWSEFEKDDTYLDQIEISVESRPAEVVTKFDSLARLYPDKKDAKSRVSEFGTVLRMSGLRQNWEYKHFEKLRKTLSRLVAPQSGENFSIRMEVPEKYNEFNAEITQPDVFKYPHYKVNGEVRDDGSFSYQLELLVSGKKNKIHGQYCGVYNSKNQRYEIREILDKADEAIDSKKPECGPFKFEFRVWDRDELGNIQQKTHSTIQSIRTDLDSLAGISIYRDSFRVLPYGEPQDDWLRLDIRRVQKPTLRLSNNQIYGLIYITSDANKKLKDQSNREGMDENQAMSDLRSIVLLIINRLENERYDIRPRRATDKTTQVAGGIFSPFQFNKLNDYLKSKPDQKLADIVANTEELFNEQLKEIQVVMSRYQRLATLGQLIDQVLHDGRQPVTSIRNSAELGEESLNRQPLPLENVKKKFQLIISSSNILSTLFSRMEPFSGRKRGRPLRINLESVILKSFDICSTLIKRTHTSVKISDTETFVTVDESEIQEVLLNLINNSLYWLEQAPPKNRLIRVAVTRTNDSVEIYFSDSGPGVSESIKDKIFDPYFSTREDGVGLGLAISGEIITDYYGGKLELLQSGDLPGACFKITLRTRI